MIETMTETADRKDGSVHIVEKSVNIALEALYADMDQHLKTIRDSVAQVESKILEKKKLLASLPANISIAPTGVRVSNQVYKADGELTFQVTSREQALALFNTLPGVPLVKVDGGVSAFVPETRFDNSNPAIKPPTPVAPLVYRISHFLGKLQEEYYWWTTLGSMLVRITVVNATVTTAKVASRHRREGIDKIRLVWEYQGLPRGTLMYWYGSTETSVAPVTVHLDREASVSDAYANQMPALYSQVTSKCTCN